LCKIGNKIEKESKVCVREREREIDEVKTETERYYLKYVDNRREGERKKAEVFEY